MKPDREHDCVTVVLGNQYIDFLVAPSLMWFGLNPSMEE